VRGERNVNLTIPVAVIAVERLVLCKVDDFGSGDELLRHFQIERVALPAHPALELRHNPALAIAEPAAFAAIVEKAKGHLPKAA